MYDFVYIIYAFVKFLDKPYNYLFELPTPDTMKSIAMSICKMYHFSCKIRLELGQGTKIFLKPNQLQFKLLLYFGSPFC